MWKPLQTLDATLLYQCNEENDKLSFYITDFIRLWRKTLTKGEFAQIFVTENPSLTGNDSAIILEMALDMMSEEKPGLTKSVAWKVEEEAHLSYTFKRAGSITLKISLILEPCDTTEFYKLVTLDLLSVIEDMKRGESDLKHIIQKKDTEIDEYKNLGATISIKYLITEKFDEKKFESQHPQYNRSIKSFEDALQKEIQKSNVNHEEKSAKQIVGSKRKVDNIKRTINAAATAEKSPSTINIIKSKKHIKRKMNF